jgi:hypothetical protein
MDVDQLLILLTIDFSASMRGTETEWTEAEWTEAEWTEGE